MHRGRHAMRDHACHALPARAASVAAERLVVGAPGVVQIHVAVYIAAESLRARGAVRRFLNPGARRATKRSSRQDHIAPRAMLHAVALLQG